MNNLTKAGVPLSFVQTVEDLIQRNDLDLALREIQIYVLKVITNPNNTGKIFDSPELDFLCKKIGHQSFEKIKQEAKKGAMPDKGAALILASRLQTSGGHTRVIEEFLRNLPHEKKVVIVTELPARSDRNYIETRWGSLGVQVHWITRGNHAKKLSALQHKILEINPTDIFIFNHHEDSIAVAAVSIPLKSKLYFYHHADHHLCLGLHIKGSKHIDIHAFGFNNCRNNLGIKDNIYVPLIAHDHGDRPSKDFLKNGRLVTCTAAGKNKVELGHDPDYVEVIPLLLAHTKGKHVHIGKLSAYARLKIKVLLYRLGVNLNSFVYIPWVPSVWDALHQHQVDLYLSSFPITGGKTLVEALGSGTPIAIYNHPTSRLLSGQDMVYPEAHVWTRPEELFSYCSNLTTSDLIKQSQLARRHYEMYYDETLLRSFFTDDVDCPMPPLHPFQSRVSSSGPMEKKKSMLQTVTYKLRHLLIYYYKLFRSRISELLY